MHNIKGLLTKVNGRYRASDNKYLARLYNNLFTTNTWIVDNATGYERSSYVNSSHQREDGKYAGQHYNAWFDSWTYARDTYYYEHSQYVKSDHKRVDNNQIWGSYEIFNNWTRNFQDMQAGYSRTWCSNGTGYAKANGYSSGSVGNFHGGSIRRQYYDQSNDYVQWGYQYNVASCFLNITGWHN